MRVIVAGRLSRKNDNDDKDKDIDASGFDSQEREARLWAESQGHDVIDTVADYKTGRSGLEARPKLREWVTDPAKLASYDGIVALKVDRLTRGDRAETSKLEDWARSHGKALLIAGADAHFPSEGHDGIVWDLMLRMAHQEWVNISDRYRRGQRTAALNGGQVGRVCWGYRVTGPKYGKRIVLDESLAPYLRDMVSKYLDGASLAEIGAWLDSEGIPADRGGMWSAKSVAQILDKPVLAGRHEFTATDDNGRPKRYRVAAPAVITMSQWRALQAKRQEGKTRTRGPVLADAPLLVGVATCGVCSGPMYKHTSGNRRRDGSVNINIYYRCVGPAPKQRSDCHNMIKLSALDAAVHQYMSDDVARASRMLTQRIVPGSNQDDAIARLDQDIRALDPGDADWLDQAAALKRERDRLAGLPVVPDAVVLDFTGQTLAEVWESLPDTAARRAFLVSAGALVTVRPGATPDVAVSWRHARYQRDGGLSLALGRPDRD
jgi:DNA invertase Pin-like site-specific DNA recombinase